MVVVYVRAVIILLSFAIEPVLVFFERRAAASPEHHGSEIVRIADGTFQLLRMALWGSEYNGGWERPPQDDLVRNAREVFALLTVNEDRIEYGQYVREQESLLSQNVSGNPEESADTEST